MAATAIDVPFVACSALYGLPSRRIHTGQEAPVSHLEGLPLMPTVLAAVGSLQEAERAFAPAESDGGDGDEGDEAGEVEERALRADRALRRVARARSLSGGDEADAGGEEEEAEGRRVSDTLKMAAENLDVVFPDGVQVGQEPAVPVRGWVLHATVRTLEDKETQYGVCATQWRELTDPGRLGDLRVQAANPSVRDPEAMERGAFRRAWEPRTLAVFLRVDLPLLELLRAAVTSFVDALDGGRFRAFHAPLLYLHAERVMRCALLPTRFPRPPDCEPVHFLAHGSPTGAVFLRTGAADTHRLRAALRFDRRGVRLPPAADVPFEPDDGEGDDHEGDDQAGDDRRLRIWSARELDSLLREGVGLHRSASEGQDPHLPFSPSAPSGHSGHSERPPLMPLVDVDWSVLFSRLSPRSIVRWLHAVLLQRGVVVVSRDTTILADACEAITALTAPIGWDLSYVPHAPSDTFELVREHRFPYIFGTHPIYFADASTDQVAPPPLGSPLNEPPSVRARIARLQREVEGVVRWGTANRRASREAKDGDGEGEGEGDGEEEDEEEEERFVAQLTELVSRPFSDGVPTAGSNLPAEDVVPLGDTLQRAQFVVRQARQRDGSVSDEEWEARTRLEQAPSFARADSGGASAVEEESVWMASLTSSDRELDREVVDAFSMMRHRTPEEVSALAWSFGCASGDVRAKHPDEVLGVRIPTGEEIDAKLARTLDPHTTPVVVVDLDHDYVSPHATACGDNLGQLPPRLVARLFRDLCLRGHATIRAAFAGELHSSGVLNLPDTPSSSISLSSPPTFPSSSSTPSPSQSSASPAAGLADLVAPDLPEAIQVVRARFDEVTSVTRVARSRAAAAFVTARADGLQQALQELDDRPELEDEEFESDHDHWRADRLASSSSSSVPERLASAPSLQVAPSLLSPLAERLPSVPESAGDPSSSSSARIRIPPVSSTATSLSSFGRGSDVFDSPAPGAPGATHACSLQEELDAVLHPHHPHSQRHRPSAVPPGTSAPEGSPPVRSLAALSAQVAPTTMALRGPAARRVQSMPSPTGASSSSSSSSSPGPVAPPAPQSPAGRSSLRRAASVLNDEEGDEVVSRGRHGHRGGVLSGGWLDAHRWASVQGRLLVARVGGGPTGAAGGDLGDGGGGAGTGADGRVCVLDSPWEEWRLVRQAQRSLDRDERGQEDEGEKKEDEWEGGRDKLLTRKVLRRVLRSTRPACRRFRRMYVRTMDGSASEHDRMWHPVASEARLAVARCLVAVLAPYRLYIRQQLSQSGVAAADGASTELPSSLTASVSRLSFSSSASTSAPGAPAQQDVKDLKDLFDVEGFSRHVAQSDAGAFVKALAESPQFSMFLGTDGVVPSAAIAWFNAWAHERITSATMRLRNKFQVAKRGAVWVWTQRPRTVFAQAPAQWERGYAELAPKRTELRWVVGAEEASALEQLDDLLAAVEDIKRQGLDSADAVADLEARLARSSHPHHAPSLFGLFPASAHSAGELAGRLHAATALPAPDAFDPVAYKAGLEAARTDILQNSRGKSVHVDVSNGFVDLLPQPRVADRWAFEVHAAAEHGGARVCFGVDDEEVRLEWLRALRARIVDSADRDARMWKTWHSPRDPASAHVDGGVRDALRRRGAETRRQMRKHPK